MSRKYYYLAASLPDLFRGHSSGAGSLEEFLSFCREVLHPEDLSSLKQLFLFNDLRNAVDYIAKDDPFVEPSFYDREQILQFREEPDPSIPFVGRYLAAQDENEEGYPGLTPIDSAISLFYEETHRITDDFVRSYFLHELELRNITTTLELRSNNFELKNKLIPHGVAYSNLLAAEGTDWGLSEEFPFIKSLLPLYSDSDLSAREAVLDEIRWHWCDEALEDELFSFHAIVGYGIKLMSVERWSALDEEAGNELFMDLLGTVQRSVRFAIEFAHLGAEQLEERKRQEEGQ